MPFSWLYESRWATLGEAFSRPVAPTAWQNPPHWVAFNDDLAHELGLPAPSPELLNLFAGSLHDERFMPRASVYSGHQFGIWAGQLGDGRALLLGDVRHVAGNNPNHTTLHECQLKGAGKTPYSRFADGRAVLRSSIREYLGSEAMHGLGIATSRALALVGSDDMVYRERAETAAILCRTAPNFVRFGHFEHFAAKGDAEHLQQLCDFVCAQIDGSLHTPQDLLHYTVYQTAQLIAQWQSVGFCHGVMNTDNLSILGYTIDYGPFGFLEQYDRYHVCNQSDRQARYSYQNQPYVAHWNLARLADALSVIAPAAELHAIVETFPQHFTNAYQNQMRAKLGLHNTDASDPVLLQELSHALQRIKPDFTLFFRYLCDITPQHDATLPAHFTALFAPHSDMKIMHEWIAQYRCRLRQENRPNDEKRTQMLRTNPLYIARNHHLQNAIAAAEQGDFSVIARLHECLRDPFTERPEYAEFAEPLSQSTEQVHVSCSS